MAIHIDPRPFSGGAVVFNSQPSVNFYAKMLAERQAKEDAIGEYVKGLNTKITPTGVRTQDLPAFQKMYSDWQTFGMNNMKEMARNPMLKSQFASKAQELMNFAEESKKAEVEKKPIVDILTDPKKRETLSTSFMPMVQSHDEPLMIPDESGNLVPNPNRKRLDYTSNMFNPPTIDVPKHFEGLVKGMEKEEKVGDVVGKNPVTGQAIVSFTKGFSPSQVSSIASMAARQFDADPSVKGYYQHRIETMPIEEHKQLNDIYQSAFGGIKTKVRPDGRIIGEDFVGDDPRKLAMAEAIKYAKGLESSGTKPAQDYQQRQQDKFDYAAFNSGLIAGRGGAKKDEGQIDLRVYPTAPEVSPTAKNITDMMGGVKFSVDPSGNSMIAKKVIYDPQNKNFYVDEWFTRGDDGNIKNGDKRKVIPFTKFIQDVKTINPTTDMKFLQGLENPITTGNDKSALGEAAGKGKTATKTSGGTSDWKSRAKTVK